MTTITSCKVNQPYCRRLQGWVLSREPLKAVRTEQAASLGAVGSASAVLQKPLEVDSDGIANRVLRLHQERLWVGKKEPTILTMTDWLHQKQLQWHHVIIIMSLQLLFWRSSIFEIASVGQCGPCDTHPSSYATAWMWLVHNSGHIRRIHVRPQQRLGNPC